MFSKSSLKFRSVKQKVTLSFYLMVMGMLSAAVSIFYYQDVAVIGSSISTEEAMGAVAHLKISALIIIIISAVIAWFLCSMIAEAVTKEITSEKKQKEQIFKVYKDVMFAVSQGKFVLVNEEELLDYIAKGSQLAEQAIAKPEDVSVCRHLVEDVLTMYSIDPKEIRKNMLAISEAATNVVKHAVTGKLTILLCGGAIKMVLTDRGPGMPFDKIPYMVFFGGFSTKISLGFGFSLMYQCTDKILLHTSTSGTTVIMEKIIAPEVPMEKQNSSRIKIAG